MAITLLPLATGRVSLEFTPNDAPVVAEAIRARFGVPTVSRFPLAAEYSFGGSRFAFQSEWDDLCLISDSPEGDCILRGLHDVLAARGEAEVRSCGG